MLQEYPELWRVFLYYLKRAGGITESLFNSIMMSVVASERTVYYVSLKETQQQTVAALDLVVAMDYRAVTRALSFVDGGVGYEFFWDQDPSELWIPDYDEMVRSWIDPATPMAAAGAPDRPPPSSRRVRYFKNEWLGSPGPQALGDVPKNRYWSRELTFSGQTPRTREPQMGHDPFRTYPEAMDHEERGSATSSEERASAQRHLTFSPPEPGEIVQGENRSGFSVRGRLDSRRGRH